MPSCTARSANASPRRWRPPPPSPRPGSGWSGMRRRGGGSAWSPQPTQCWRYCSRPSCWGHRSRGRGRTPRRPPARQNGRRTLQDAPKHLPHRCPLRPHPHRHRHPHPPRRRSRTAKLPAPRSHPARPPDPRPPRRQPLRCSDRPLRRQTRAGRQPVRIPLRLPPRRPALPAPRPSGAPASAPAGVPAATRSASASVPATPPVPRGAASAAAARSPAASAPDRPAPTALRKLYINVGLFAEPANARRAHGMLRSAGLPAATQPVTAADGRQLLRVRAGPFTSASQANAAAARIRALGLETSAASSQRQ